MRNTIAVIPARSGSKRIPKKNIALIQGQPALARTIKNLHTSAIFDRIIVSTDSEEFGRIATGAGAEVPFHRPTEISGDHTPTKDVIIHALEMLGIDDDAQVCCVYPTAVLSQSDTYIDSYQLSNHHSAKFVFPISLFRSNPQRALLLAEDNQSIRPLNLEFSETRTQDLEPQFYDAGQFYWGSSSLWRSKISIHENAIGFKVPWWQAIDVDDSDDLELLNFTFDYVERTNK